MNSTKYSIDTLKKFHKDNSKLILSANKNAGKFQANIIESYINVYNDRTVFVTEYIDCDGVTQYHNVIL